MATRGSVALIAGLALTLGARGAAGPQEGTAEAGAAVGQMVQAAPAAPWDQYEPLDADAVHLDELEQALLRREELPPLPLGWERGPQPRRLPGERDTGCTDESDRTAAPLETIESELYIYDAPGERLIISSRASRYSNASAVAYLLSDVWREQQRECMIAEAERSFGTENPVLWSELQMLPGDGRASMVTALKMEILTGGTVTAAQNTTGCVGAGDVLSCLSLQSIRTPDSPASLSDLEALEELLERLAGRLAEQLG